MTTALLHLFIRGNNGSSYGFYIVTTASYLKAEDGSSLARAGLATLLLFTSTGWWVTPGWKCELLFNIKRNKGAFDGGLPMSHIHFKKGEGPLMGAGGGGGVPNVACPF